MYYLFIHELSLSKKVVTDDEEAERLMDKNESGKSGFVFEAMFGTRKELNDYYKEYIN